MNEMWLWVRSCPLWGWADRHRGLAMIGILAGAAFLAAMLLHMGDNSGGDYWDDVFPGGYM